MSHSDEARPCTRIAAVTGASRGIGRATALRLAAAGYRVFALARSEPDLRSLEAEAGARGFRIDSIPMDIERDDSRRAAVEAVFAATDGYGLDILVNNAGYGQFGPLEEVTTEQFRRQLEVNVIGLLAFTQPFLPGMRARRTGRIVNVSSAAGRTATPFMGAYNASKFALEGLSDALRLELYPFDIRVVLIAPGPIKTNFGETADREMASVPNSPYAPYMRTWQKAHGRTNVFGRSSDAVARVIVRAVEAQNPRPRYTITASAKLGAVARRLAPDRLTDWVLRRAAGLR